MNQLKPWSEMTEDEIAKIITTQCKRCRFLGKLSGTGSKNAEHYYCNYLGIMGVLRKCRPDMCDKYEPKGKRRKRTSNEVFRYEAR